MKIITRKDAFEAGLKRFYTGRPCQKGHDAERFVSTGNCVKCNAERSKLFSRDASTASLARARSQFVYPCHPDDAAALLAYAQGLDLARGRTPFVPGAVARPLTDATPQDVQALRASAYLRAQGFKDKADPPRTIGNSWERDGK